MTRQLFRLGLLTAMAFALLCAGEIRKESGNLIVWVTDADGQAGKPRVELQRRGAWGSITIDLNNHTEAVSGILLPAPDRIVIQGKLRPESRDDVFTIISASSRNITDTIWMRDAAVSPDAKTVAYQFHTPTSTGQIELQASLVGYDLSASPASNTMVGTNSGDPAARGIVLYPEANRISRRYWTVLSQGAEAVCDQPKHAFISPIAWSPDSTRVAVVEHAAGENHLVVVDISHGLHEPSVVVDPIEREQFLQPRFVGAIPAEYSAGVYPTFSELRFSEDGRSVTMKSWAVGPFAETIVIVHPSEPAAR